MALAGLWLTLVLGLLGILASKYYASATNPTGSHTLAPLPTPRPLQLTTPSPATVTPAPSGPSPSPVPPHQSQIYEEEESIVAAIAESELLGETFADSTPPGTLGVRPGVDFFAVYHPEYGDVELAIKRSERPPPTVEVFRERPEENLAPVPYHFAFDPTDDSYECRYEKYSRYAEEGIVCSEHEGSGGFLTMHLLAWMGGRYIDLLRDDTIDGAAHAFFSFADLDADGTRELVLVHGWKAYAKEAQFFHFDQVHARYVEVPPRSAFYPTFHKKLHAIRENAVFPDADTDWFTDQ